MAVVVRVRERIEVAERESMKVDRVGVHVELVVDAEGHRVAEWVRVVDLPFRYSGRGPATPRHRLDQRCSLSLACGRNQIQRAELIVLAPSAPVRELLEQTDRTGPSSESRAGRRLLLRRKA